MRIAKLDLQNIGVFEHRSIEFRQKSNPELAEIHILTGVNGSSKSTILYALASAFVLTPELLQRRFRYDDSRSQVGIGCTNSSEQLHIRHLGYDENKTFRYLKNDALLNLYNHNAIKNLRTVQNQEFNFAAFAYSRARTISSTTILAIQELSTNPLSDALNFQKPVDTKQLTQWIANTKAKVAFARQDNEVERAEQYQSAIERIEDAITEIVGYRVEFGFNYEPLNVTIKMAERELEFDLLPDGLKSIISWLADLLMRLDRIKWVDNQDILARNFILFLDEIEIHLHPAWQRQILPVIQKLFKNAQIFIATHSPFVVASVSDAWVYRFAVEQGESRLDSVDVSKAGSIYVTVLDEIFGIDEFFDPATEDDFEEFERLNQEVLSGNHSKLPTLMQVAEKLSAKSIEVQDIVGE